MKKLIFLTLKILEVSVIVFVPWWMGKIPLVARFWRATGFNIFETWLIGSVTMLSVISMLWLFGILIFLVIPELFRANTRLTNKIFAWLKKGKPSKE